MFIVDAHLDLAYNALRGREVLRPAVEQTADREGIPSVGLPDLHAGRVGLICATIFCAPSSNNEPGYRNADEAREAGLRQVEWYAAREREGVFRFVRTQSDLPTGEQPTGTGPLPAIMLLEGADPLRTPADVREWHAAGMRIVGLAWRQTRYAGGTGAPGPLTPAGIELLAELDRFGIIHDLSHLAEESFWQLLDHSPGPVMASHSNCRTFVPTDRQLSDEMIRAIVARDGVIAMNFFDKFLLRPDVYKTRRATVFDVIEHMQHICSLAGNANHVAIGTDMDGGLGRDEIPQEIKTAADLPRMADGLSSAGFTDSQVAGVMGGNWLRFFRRTLPAK
jgi:membrane dipeptidase